jgi:hypothetical protein
MSSAEQSLKRLEQSTDRVARSTRALTRLTVGITAAYGAFKAAMAAMGGMSAINAAYDRQADSVRGLETALRLQGEEVEGNSARLQGFASQLQQLAGVGDEATLALMKKASTLGITADQMEDATKATIGLSEATGMGLDASLRAVQQAMEGNFSMLERQVPALRGMATEEEKLAHVLDLANRGLLAKADASNTASGMSERASNALGDLMESVGALLAPLRMIVSQGIIVFAEAWMHILEPAVAMAKTAMENIGPVLDWLREKIVNHVNRVIAAFTFIEVIVTNLDSVWAMMAANAELRLRQLAGIVMHALTVEIPAYAGWFAENFVNLIRDGLTAAYMVVVNSVTNIIDAFQALWDFIASGGQTDILGSLGEIAGRSYLEGFESSLTSLPEIAERSITAREKELSEKIGQIGNDLGEQFATKFADRAIKLGEGVGDSLATDIDLAVNKKIDDSLAKKTGAGGAAGGATLSASESRLLTRGPANRQEDFLAMIARDIAIVKENTADSASQNKKASDTLDDVASNTEGTLQLVMVS